jgi:hypothetical protein
MTLSETSCRLIEQYKINIAQIAVDAVSEELRVKLEADRTLAIETAEDLRAQVHQLKDQLWHKEARQLVSKLKG